jgi:glycosyltransferase involved in cell wall biosynthesis
MSAESRPVQLSVIVPLYKVQECVKPLYMAISAQVPQIGRPYEILFVDDGSTDDTFRIATTLASDDPCLRILKLRRNYGQTPAMAAGVDQARGDILITMDGDLQNDPADIPQFLEKIDEGNDIVAGWRYQRQDRLISRRIPSMIANWLIGKVTRVPIKYNVC